MSVITISVTHDDIAQGIAGACLLCPIAKAAARAGLKHPSVDNLFIYFGPFENRQREPLPAAAKNFIYRFDAGCSTEPFSFEVNSDG